MSITMSDYFYSAYLLGGVARLWKNEHCSVLDDVNSIKTAIIRLITRELFRWQKLLYRRVFR